ncbi:MAG TPA: transporter substrate-binding domain-containing protein [Paracoccus sp. (in: a-proteobacteria)]|uniref:transporter substrate-binding domain-containing protein n=1 Tax=Paracoccus sp. TaxID=267 RepID=UPI002C342164|nr:transporter substrate-binding domain-containing protein [Paracoccus sp. (in: a-proteobacteria)]HWL58254.1 transporter substrate-binding domain-containing protein [Paracoccus sp. (in: a-proteobacteria)]
MKLTLTAALFTATALFTGIAHADSLADIKERGTIRVAIDLGAPPYGQLDASAKPAGSDVEAATELAKDLGVTLQIVPVTGPNRVPFLLTDKADIVMASFSITEERKKVIDYSEPYGVVPTVIGAPKSVKAPDFAALAGKAVAVTRGTTSDQALSKGADGVDGLRIVRYEDDATTNTAVATGQQDLIAAAASVISQVNVANPARDLEIKFVMSAAPYAIGIRKDEPELKAWLDEWVKGKIASDELNTIYSRHFGIDLPAEFRPAN